MSIQPPPCRPVTPTLLHWFFSVSISTITFLGRCKQTPIHPDEASLIEQRCGRSPTWRANEFTGLIYKCVDERLSTGPWTSLSAFALSPTHHRQKVAEAPSQAPPFSLCSNSVSVVRIKHSDQKATWKRKCLFQHTGYNPLPWLVRVETGVGTQSRLGPLSIPQQGTYFMAKEERWRMLSPSWSIGQLIPR